MSTLSDQQHVDRWRSLKTWGGRLAPWVIAIVVAVVLLRKYDPNEVLAQMKSGNTWGMLPIPFFLPFFYLLLGAMWERIVLRSTLGGPKYVDILRGRAGTAILMLVGYFFGHGAFGFWLARKTGATAKAVSGVVIYNMLSDLSGLSLIAMLAIMFGHAKVSRVVELVALGTLLIPMALVLIGPSLLANGKRTFFDPWRKVPRSHAIVQIAGRSFNVALIVFATWCGALVFGVPIPLGAFATWMPLILLATALPISVAGFGAAQAAWLVFLPYASGEQILAFQLLWQVFMGMGIVVRGLPFIRRVVREVRGF
jgi:hypothetical protein